MNNIQKQEKIRQMLLKIGLPAEDTAVRQLLQYYEMLSERNRIVNLTAITEFDEVTEKHFADSLLIVKAVDFSKTANLIDVGTGGGFPGMVLKILFPDLQIILLDSLQKRIGFLNDVIYETGLKKIRTIHGRAEDYGKDPSYRETYDLCVSRAVADLAVLSELCIPFVRKGGMFVSYKTAGAAEEIENAKNAIHVMGGDDPRICKAYLPASGQERWLVCIGKTEHTPSKYPRKAGIPAKRPL